MAFIFMVFHWPEPSHRERLTQGMREMRDLLLATPGCLSVEPPYLIEGEECLVGISKWASKEVFLAAGIQLRPPDEIVEGETRPRQRFFLNEAPPSFPS